MKPRVSTPRPSPRSTAMRVALCAVALAGAAAATTDATASIVTYNTPLSVPNTANGLFINILTGDYATNGLLLPGWDVDFYTSGSFGLGFFWQSVGASAGVAGTASGPYSDVTAGTTISAASIFATTSAPTATSAFRVAGDHTLGLRFFNETTGALNYGYMNVTVGSPSGFPLTINSWSFENTGAAITVGGGGNAVPEPDTGALSFAALALLGVVGLRRKHRHPAG